MIQEKDDFTQGRILPKFFRFVLPVLGALLLQAAYGATDLAVVGWFGDKTGTAAVGTGSAVMQLVTVIIAGVTMGATVVIGQLLGERKPEDAGRAIGSSVWLFGGLAVILTILMELLTEPLVRLMNAPEEAFLQTVTYVRICSAGIVLITAYNGISGVFRGLGNSRLPLLFVAIAAAFNVAGDFILVGAFRMDVAGAAIATVAAQGLSVVLSLLIIRRHQMPFTMNRASMRPDRRLIRRILRVGTPIALQDALVHLSFLLINSAVNAIGIEQSAGYGVAERVTAFIFLVPSAVMAGVSAFVAQNMGAVKRDRAKKTTFLAMGIGCAFGVLLFCAGFFGGEILSGLFSHELDVVEQSAMYLRGFSADCLLTCVLFAFIGYFNGCGKTVYVMIQGITSSFLFRVPLSWLFARIPGATLTTIGFAAPIATVYGIVFCIVCYFLMERKEKKLV